VTPGAAVNPLLVVGGIAALFALLRDFTQVMGIYFLAATVLYGLSYASLIVFRRREREVPAHVFRCPWGPAMAVTAIAPTGKLTQKHARQDTWSVSHPPSVGPKIDASPHIAAKSPW
jgi:hypothetical protein